MNSPAASSETTKTESTKNVPSTRPSLFVNGQSHEIDAPPDTPLLWVLRDNLGLTGTKYGCGKALCGACTVHIDGQATRACITPVSEVIGRKITTIEGISSPGRQEKQLHVIQQAWIDNQVSQCGFCQSGQIMSAIALLQSKPNPSDQEIDDAMSGNICRCGTYQRIRAAIKLASQSMEL